MRFLACIFFFVVFVFAGSAHEFEKTHVVIIGTPDTPQEDYGDVIPSWEATASDWDDNAKHSHEDYDKTEVDFRKAGNRFVIMRHTHRTSEVIGGTDIRETDVKYDKGPWAPENFRHELSGTRVTLKWKPSKRFVVLEGGSNKVIDKIGTGVVRYEYSQGQAPLNVKAPTPIGDTWINTGVDPEIHGGDLNHIYSFSKTLASGFAYSFMISSVDIRGRRKISHRQISLIVGGVFGAPSLQKGTLATMWASLKMRK